MTATSRTSDKFVVRLPDGLRDELRKLAIARHRSMNGQMVAILEQGIAAEKTASGQP
ncbi:Arc family DNA-binding protein [Sphingobium sp. PNB]|uniref:Arc family DNA-binding protein n=1 Tax=Sphingobium sp. PNB TaxID=863934 RepID=UPI001CA397E4|nr:Arc family DNA-binding protein [Sphingobium sp. PNB]MCB4862398.1 Arc family DNA-binding protein [Sphingobium sp. PNB]